MNAAQHWHNLPKNKSAKDQERYRPLKAQSDEFAVTPLDEIIHRSTFSLKKAGVLDKAARQRGHCRDAHGSQASDVSWHGSEKSETDGFILSAIIGWSNWQFCTPCRLTKGMDWVNEMQGNMGVKRIAIDGKSLRRSHDHSAARKMLHCVCAWSVENQLVLGEQAVDEKSNDTAIPKLLDVLELKGATVTSCQKEIDHRWRRPSKPVPFPINWASGKKQLDISNLLFFDDQRS